MNLFVFKITFYQRGDTAHETGTQPLHPVGRPPSECTAVYINPAPLSPGFISAVSVLPAPALYLWFLRRNVWFLVARNRAKIWLTSFAGRFSPARHHGSLPSNLTKDCTRSSSLLILKNKYGQSFAK